MISIALKKLCNGCNKVTINYAEKYCPECKEKYGDNGRKKYNKDYDQRRKDDKHYLFYKSKDWQQLRDYVLKYYKYLDLYEYAINKRIVLVNTVHHVVEVRDDWNKRLEFNNMFPCSESTHNVIHALMKKDKLGTQMMLIEILKSYQTM